MMKLIHGFLNQRFSSFIYQCLTSNQYKSKIDYVFVIHDSYDQRELVFFKALTKPFSEISKNAFCTCSIHS